MSGTIFIVIGCIAMGVAALRFLHSGDDDEGIDTTVVSVNSVYEEGAYSCETVPRATDIVLPADKKALNQKANYDDICRTEAIDEY